MAQSKPPVCVVTGVGAGTGAAVCRRFASEGHRVAMLARSAERLAEFEARDPGQRRVPHRRHRRGVARATLQTRSRAARPGARAGAQRRQRELRRPAQRQHREVRAGLADQHAGALRLRPGGRPRHDRRRRRDDPGDRCHRLAARRRGVRRVRVRKAGQRALAQSMARCSGRRACTSPTWSSTG